LLSRDEAWGPTAVFLRGLCEARLGESAAALATLEPLAVQTGVERGLDWTAGLLAAQTLYDAGRFREAIDAAQRVIDSRREKLPDDYPRYPFFDDRTLRDDAQFLIGLCYDGLDNTREALRALAEICLLYPKTDKCADAEVTKLTSDLLRRIGEHE
jgi:tetratricopeptide (TPR) repeat protein